MKKLTRIRCFVDKKKEEEYLNEMNKKGWKLEYLQFGCIFNFTESEPNEYFTSIYATDKPKVLQMTSAAILSGYDNIPHTYDGRSNFLYLTGKKGKVDKNFISDNENRRSHFKHLSIFYKKCALAALLTAIIAIICMILCTPTIYKAIYCINNNILVEHHSLFISLFVVGGIITIAILVLITYCVLYSRLYFNCKKQCDTLNSDMKLYE
ncbi:MAG: DUF2812 domain-containing protein [Clostridia bacterium]|nr:DUF2812 domain-containing protein [Clostridia bacterium]